MQIPNSSGEVIELLNKLSVDKLNSEWVESVLDLDFTEAPNLPSEFEEFHESTNFIGLFQALVNAFRTYVDTIQVSTSTDEEKNQSQLLNSSGLSEEDLQVREVQTNFWLELSQNVKGKNLNTLLFYYIYKAQRYDAKEDDRDLGIFSSSLYLLLLSIPGSNAFQIFHPMLFLKTIEIMKLSTKLNVKASSPTKRGRSNSNRPSQNSQPPAADDDDDEGEFAMLTPQETNKLVRALNILLNDFMRFSARFSLKHSTESLDETISVLVEITKCETHNAQSIFISRHGPASVTALAYNAYVALQSLCTSLHGNVNKIVRLIMEHMLPHILMISRGLDLSARSLNVIRDHSIIFVRYILAQLEDVSHDGVYILLQQLCARVPDKAEFRTKTSQSIVDILKSVPIQIYTKFVKWVFKFSHHDKASHRLFSLEVISKMLCEEERTPLPRNDETPIIPEVSCANTTVDGSHASSFKRVSNINVDIPQNRNILSHKFLVCIILSRCRDIAATVRSKALSLLADCTTSVNPTVMSAMEQIFYQSRATCFTTPHMEENNVNCESPIELVSNQLNEFDFPNTQMIMSMLQRRALDDKMTVRKSSLQVLGSLMKLNKEMLTKTNLKVLSEHTRDPALFIRKQIIASLTGLVESFPGHEATIDTWVLTILPLILDPETKVQERVIEVVDQVLFLPLKSYTSMKDTDEDRLPWLILKHIISNTYLKFFNKIIMMWTQSELSRPQVINVMMTHIGLQYDREAWTLLSSLSQHLVIKNPNFAVTYVQDQMADENGVDSFTLQQVLRVINNSIKNVSGDLLEPLRDRILQPIENFKVKTDLISLMIDAITLLTYSLEGDGLQGQEKVENLFAPLIKSCDYHLRDILFANPAKVLDKAGEEKLFRHIYTLGECSMVCPKKVNKRMFLMLQSIIFHQSSEKNTSVIIPSSQTQSSQVPATNFVPSERLKALSIVTLGKMLLQNEQQAKKIVPALGSMLNFKTIPSIKSNIIFVLSDLCVRYATLVDPLMPQITSCLRDENIQLRRTTLTLLINLLQEDYLKLKGSFFYRILQCLTDDHEDMKSTVMFYVIERLLKRSPKILMQHFIECVFHYNCYEEHESYNKFCQNNKEKELFSLAGSKNAPSRMLIYKFMLDQMPDDQRFTITHRLCQDVLGGVVDGKIKLNQASLPMLQDTMAILSCDEIKLASLNSKTDELEHATDQQEEAAAAGMVLKKTIISQVVKKNVIENIVPILLSLKTKLEEHKSPLMKNLLLYFKELMKDYRNEIKEIFANDKQLAKEIEFDLKKLDEEEAERQMAIVYRRDSEDSRDLENAVPLAPATPNIPNRQVVPVLSNATPLAEKGHLMKRALLNSHLLSRRKSIAVPEGAMNETSKNLRRLSISDFRATHNSKNLENTYVDPRPDIQNTSAEQSNIDANDSNHTEKEVPSTPVNRSSNSVRFKTPEVIRENLLRAISTPQGNKSIINNITFINASQNLSAIGLNNTEQSENGDQLLLHFTTPDRFNKDDEFSRLKKNTEIRRSLQDDFNDSSRNQSKNNSINGKRSSGGFMQDSCMNTTEAESDISEPVAKIVKNNKKKESISNTKRTRETNSSSPDPSLSATEKVRNKKKSKGK